MRNYLLVQIINEYLDVYFPDLGGLRFKTFSTKHAQKDQVRPTDRACARVYPWQQHRPS